MIETPLMRMRALMRLAVVAIAAAGAATAAVRAADPPDSAGAPTTPGAGLPAPQDRPASVLPGRPDEDVPLSGEVDRLAARFQSIPAGISFRPPLGMKEIRRPLSNEIVRYVDDQRSWVLEVSKVELATPMELANGKKGNVVVQGLMGRTLAGIQQTTPGAEIFRQDQINVGTVDVGVIVARYSLGHETNLTQQALVRRSGTQYYIFNMTIPSPRQVAPAQDPPTREAVTTFNQVIDSVKLLDQSQVREDQNERLYRTRAFFVGMNEKRLTGVLRREQWLRILQDGKDIGYNYVVEEPGRDLPREGEIGRELAGPEGILIGIRGRLYPRPGWQADQISWMWMSADRKEEKWSHIARARRIGAQSDDNLVGNIGVVDTTTRHVKDPDLAPGEKTNAGWDMNQPAVRAVEVSTLTAKSPYGGGPDTTITRELPVWYVPQALGYVLPSLMTSEGSRTFLFASWVPEKQEVMTRYVEVLGERDGELAGHTVHGIVVQDRFGLEGSVSTTYVDKDGTFLGSYNADSKLTVLPSDAQTLQKLWKDANLTRPGAVEQSADTLKITRAHPDEPAPEGAGLDSLTPLPQAPATGP